MQSSASQARRKTVKNLIYIYAVDVVELNKRNFLNHFPINLGFEMVVLIMEAESRLYVFKGAFNDFRKLPVRSGPIAAHPV